MDDQSENADRQGWLNVSNALLIIVAVMFVLALTSVLRPYGGQGLSRQAKVKATKVQISNFETALDAFKDAVGRYPTVAEGLDVLVVKPANDPGDWIRPFMKNVPMDPWGNEYQYVCPGVHNKNSFDLHSFGPDGKPGTDDDIVNWQRETVTN
jgi:general secretion pathway protein G